LKYLRFVCGDGGLGLVVVDGCSGFRGRGWPNAPPSPRLALGGFYGGLEALKRAPLEACTVREVKGFGRQKSYLDQYGESEYSQAFLPKVEIQLWVDDARVAEVVERITAVARTGRMGDGKIFVLPTVADVPWPAAD
jgi:nitrogen regulatory protein PII